MSDEPYKKIAKITSTHLGWDDRGFFRADLSVDYGDSTQVIGLMALGHQAIHSRDPAVREAGLPIMRRAAGAFVAGVLAACGVDRWEDLRGRTIFVLCADDSWSANRIGLENLPTEPGRKFLFREWHEFSKSLGDE